MIYAIKCFSIINKTSVDLVVHITALLGQYIQYEYCLASAIKTVSETELCFINLLLEFTVNTGMNDFYKSF